jgi:glycosyltransferase involved in cell wall biosynthesis
VGRISPWKGQHIFVDAAAEILRQYPDTRFQIIGSAMFGEEKYESQIRDQVTSLGLSSKIELTGFCDDVFSLINKLDVLVHASTMGEPFGQVVVEGMVAGKPVVATSGGGILEIVLDGQTGYLVPMGDASAMAAAVCKLLADPVGASEMGLRGRARVLQHFTIDITAQKVQSIYAEFFQ